MGRGLTDEASLPGALCVRSTQVYNCVTDYMRHLEGVGAALVVGGMDNGEIHAGLKSGCDIVVATTGKLMDLIKRGQVRGQRTHTGWSPASWILMGWLDDEWLRRRTTYHFIACRCQWRRSGSSSSTRLIGEAAPLDLT